MARRRSWTLAPPRPSFDDVCVSLARDAAALRLIRSSDRRSSDRTSFRRASQRTTPAQEQPHVARDYRHSQPILTRGPDDLRGAAAPSGDVADAVAAAGPRPARRHLRAAGPADRRPRRAHDRPHRDYVAAARAAGASPTHVLVHHLLPAPRGYVLTQASLLLPAFILAEATMSFVGLGFQGDVATWGTMLHDASNVALLGDAPWTLAPTVPIFLVTLGVNIAARDSGIRG
jgi:hypothetical protein